MNLISHASALRNAPIRVCSALVLALVCAPALAANAAADTVAVKCGRLIDVVNKRSEEKVAILVENERITQTGSFEIIPRNAKVIDLGSATCVPGLFDLHAHLSADGSGDTSSMLRSNAANALIELNQAQMTLQDGFTTIRSVGETTHYGIIDVKHAIEKGKFQGPRLFAAPHMWGPTGGHGDINNAPSDMPNELVGFRVKAGTDNVRELVREELKHGADWIKIAASGGVMSEHDDVTVAGFTQEEINAFADETHRYKKKITSHIHGNAAAVMVAKAGFDSIEHGTMIEDDAIELMLKNDVWLVPTVWIVNAVAARCEMEGPQRPSESNCRKIRQVKAVRDESFRKAYTRGVKMGFGVDSIYGVKYNPKEFEALVDLGVSPMDALAMATINSATLMDLQSDLGSIEAGKLADIVAVPGNPLKDITEMEKVRFVMMNGKVIRNDF